MFTGTENHDISLVDAAKLTKAFRNILSPLLGGIKGHYFSKAALLDVLNQEDAVGVRIYLGLSNDIVPLPRLVIAGVKADGSDMDSGKIIDQGIPCPPSCSATNSLNSTI